MSKDILLKNGVASYGNDVTLKRDQKRDGGILVKNFILEVLAEDTCCVKNLTADTATLSGALTGVSASFSGALTAASVTLTKVTATQATSKTTAVTLNGAAGVVTTVALTDAADAAFTFTLTNSSIAATSVILTNVNMNGGNGKAIVNVTPGAGSATFTVTNVGTAAFNSAIKIGFVVI